MGCYINPANESKEDFLEREGMRLPKAPKWGTIPDGFLPVCLVLNSRFTAAGIAYSENELRVFANPKDSRIKFWYFVPIEKLRDVSPIDEYLERDNAS